MRRHVASTEKERATKKKRTMCSLCASGRRLARIMPMQRCSTCVGVGVGVRVRARVRMSQP